MQLIPVMAGPSTGRYGLGHTSSTELAGVSNMNMPNHRTFHFWRTRFSCAIAVACALSLAPVTAAAQPESQDNEVLASASFFHTQDADNATITADLSYGHFLSDQWELGILQAISSNVVENADDTFIATTAPFIDYNFVMDEDRDMVPYLGAFIGGVWNDEDFTGTLGPRLGLKLYPYEHVFLAFGYRYEWFFDDLELNSFQDDFDTIKKNRADGNHVVNFGIGITW